MMTWPRPNNPKSLRDILGLIGYYIRFIRLCRILTRSLTKLLKNKAFK